MTVATTDSFGVNEYDDMGLGDIDASDLVIPRLNILHKDGLFKDNLSGQTYSELNVIILGLVKQRIMWSSENENNARPQCKSPDNAHGFPNVDPKASLSSQFPWEESNFEPSDAVPISFGPGIAPAFPEGYSSNGSGCLNCAACKFTEWGTNPKTAKSVPPLCSEQHTYIVLYTPDGAGETWATALLTFQKTGIKPSKTYVSSFYQSKRPMFTVMTNIKLSVNTRGSVEFSTPIFRQGDPTDRNLWEEYADKMRSIRDIIRQAPRAEYDEDEGAPVASSNVNTAPATPIEYAPQPVAQPTAPVVPPQAPVAAPVAAPQPVPVVAPAPAPTQPVAAPQASAPAAPPVEVSDDDDLPF